jgi:hypothetical protein
VAGAACRVYRFEGCAIEFASVARQGLVGSQGIVAALESALLEKPHHAAGRSALLEVAPVLATPAIPLQYRALAARDLRILEWPINPPIDAG